MATSPKTDTPIPEWLQQPEDYWPLTDRDAFLRRSLKAVASAVSRFRMDDGREGPLSPSAPVKLLCALVTIVLTSLSRNFAFVAVVLSCLLVRACLLPPRAFARVAAGSLAAAGLTVIVSLPAILIGQPKATLTLGAKTLACTGCALMVAQTTPQGRLTSSLRSIGLPGIAIMTCDMALRGIVILGQTATESLTALILRSVGRNRSKRSAAGGVAGVVLLKAARSSQDTLDAMRCRGFTGSYDFGRRDTLRGVDALWMLATAVLIGLFLYLQGVLQ